MSDVASATDRVDSVSTSNANSVKQLLTATEDITSVMNELCEVSEKLQIVINK